MSNPLNFDRIKCEFAHHESGCACCGEDGFVAGTRLETEHGTRDVATLAAGDLVQTLEHGLRPVEDIHQIKVWRQPGECPACVCPLWVPEGAIGNGDEMLLQRETMVAIASRSFQHLNGVPYALLRCSDLEGFNGIRLVQPLEPTTIYQLRFDREELVVIGQGAVACCPSFLGSFGVDFLLGEETVDSTASGYPKLDHVDAKVFISLLEQDMASPPTQDDVIRSAS